MFKTICAIAAVAILSSCGETKRTGNFELKGTLSNSNIGRLDRIEGENLHPEATKNLGDQTTDLPGADDAGGFAVQIETDETG